MANTYKRVYIHLVFVVKYREALLKKEWRSKVFAYFFGILKARGHFPLAVDGYNDHVHLLFDFSLKELIPDLVRELKKASSKFIKDENLSKNRFKWQAGYGVFSVGWKERKQMIEYIRNQELHHAKASFESEYYSLMKQFEIEFCDEYMFDFSLSGDV